MSNNNKAETDLRRAEKLLLRRKEILTMPADMALDAIIDSPESLPLVHSFSEEDFFFLVNDIGLDDALPLLSLASLKQWEYIVDLDIWERDRMNLRPVLKWFDLFLKADPGRLLAWLRDEKTEFLEFCLFKNIDIRIREHDEDPSDFGEDYFTFDDVYYIRFVDDPLNLLADDPVDKQRRTVLKTILSGLAEVDHITFQKILYEVTSVIPAETEEEMYRLRNVRMAEKGFLPFDEAVGIYQPLSEGEKTAQKIEKSGMDRETAPFSAVSLYPEIMLTPDNMFAQSLTAIDSDHLFLEVQAEFAALCNQIIAADQKVIQERQQLNDIVRKACGYIGIALEQLSGKPNRSDPAVLASWVRKYSLVHLFRTGYSLAVKLKRQAEKWRDQSWFKQKDLPLSFWGEEGLGVLGGLMIKRPLFFDNYESGELYREFASLSDIVQTETTLSDVIALDTLFSQISIDPVPMPDYFLTYKNYMLTLWARHHQALSRELAPIPRNAFILFFQALIDRQKGTSSAGAGAGGDLEKNGFVGDAMKASFLKWLSSETDRSDLELAETLGQNFENLFNEIETEYGSVLAKDIEPKYVHLFILA